MTRRWGLALGMAAATTTVTPASAQFSAASRTTLAVGADPYGVSTADFNGDGRTDLAVVNGSSSSISVYLRDTTPRAFVQEEGSPFPVSTGPNYAAVADLNGDARPDLAVPGYVGDSISVLLRKPDGGFTASPSTLAVKKPVSVVVADFNGDQRLDLASASLNDVGSPGGAVFLGMPGGGFAAEPLTSLPALSRFVVSADFDKDGKPDLAFAHGATVSVLLRGTTGFVQESGSPYAVGTGPFTMVTADFDGDGRADLAVTNSEDDSVTVLLRKAAGGFSPAPGSPFAVGVGPAGIAAGDLDIDGHIDLAVASSIGGSVTLLRGHGDGTFTVKAPITDLASAHGVAIADFDGDAKPDLAVTQSAGGTVSVFFNETVADAGGDAGNPTAPDAAAPTEDAGGGDAGATPVVLAPEDDGCSCSHVGSRPAGALAAVPFVAALAAALRRRSHARRGAPPSA